MSGALSVPTLLLIAWGMAGLLWLDRSRRVIPLPQVACVMAGMALVAVAMALAIAAVPGRPLEQLVRAALLVEGVYGFVTLARREEDSVHRGR